MGTKLNLTGKKYGKLTVIKEAPKKNGSIMWYCSCECGKSLITMTNSLRMGKTKSCGCVRWETAIKNKSHITHGMTDSFVNQMFKAMHKNHTVHDDWDRTKQGGKNFEKWVLKNGWTKANKYTLKLKNNNEPISPNNCILHLLTPDLTGQEFHYLIVLGRSSKKGSTTYWDCVCKCGNELQVGTRSLLIGNTKSCGCWKKEQTQKRNKQNAIHGLKKHPLYSKWGGIKNRCTNPKMTGYKYYGGKGIKICAEWENNPAKFIHWALKAGWEKGLSIHRLNSNKNYQPDNCVFMTQSKHSTLHNNERFKT